MRLRLLGIMGMAGMLIASCTDNNNTTGNSVVPDGDKIVVGDSSYVISGETQTPPWIRTSDDDLYNMVGTYNDPVYGNTVASFLSQFSLTGPVDFGNPDSAYIDSVKLNLLFGGWYGDSLALNELEVYQLDNSLGLTSYDPHQTDEDPTSYTSISPSNLIGTLIYTAKNLAIPDSTRNSASYFPMLTIPIDKRVGLEFLRGQADGMFTSDQAFRAKFQGIYVRPTVGTKTIMKCQVEKYDTYDNTYNSNLIVYYSNEDVYYNNDTITIAEIAADSIADTVTYDFDYDGITDMKLIKPANTANWYTQLTNGSIGAANTTKTYDNLRASDIKTATNLDSLYSISSSTNRAGDGFIVKTSSERWVKAEIVSISTDTLKFKRTIYSGKQLYGFTSSRGNAFINFVNNTPNPTIANNSSIIAVKGMGAFHSVLKLPKGSEMMDTSKTTTIINRGQIRLMVAPKSEQGKEDIPKYLSLGRETYGDLIPGTSYSAILGVLDSTASYYSFNLTTYIQYLINHTSEEPVDLILKTYNDIGDPSGVLLTKPDSSLQIVYSDF